MHRILSSIRHVASWLALAGCALAAHAGGLSVNPIRITLSNTSPTAALTVSNSGSSAMVLQLQMTKWLVAEGEDRYDPTGVLLVTPPIFTLAAGASQVVRVGLGDAADAQREQAYRLFIEEVPPPPQADTPGLQVALRIGVPAFVVPASGAKPRLEWAAKRVTANEIMIQATNAGDAHGRVLGLSLRAPGDDRVLATQTAANYLLPGQKRSWTLRLDRPWPTSQVRLAATTEAGVANADLELAP